MSTINKLGNPVATNILIAGFDDMKYAKHFRFHLHPTGSLFWI